MRMRRISTSLRKSLAVPLWALILSATLFGLVAMPIVSNTGAEAGKVMVLVTFVGAILAAFGLWRQSHCPGLRAHPSKVAVMSSGLVPIGQRLVKVRNLALELGALNALFWILNRLFEKVGIPCRIFRYYFLAQPVVKTAYLPKRMGQSIAVRIIQPDDPALRDLPLDDKVLKYRFDQNAVCFGAFRKDRIVGCLWLCFSRYMEDEVRCTYILEPESSTAWDFDVYVEPEARGGYTFLRLWDSANEYMCGRGIDQSLSRISAFNPRSLASHDRLDGRRFASAAFLKIGTFQLMISTARPFVHLSVSPDRIPQLVLSGKPALHTRNIEATKVRSSGTATWLSGSIAAAVPMLLLSYSADALAAGKTGTGVDPYEAKRSYGSVLFNTPIYDPATGSYFELIETRGGASYDRASRAARKRIYKGVRGRLAVIRSRTTQQLINRVFRPDGEAWIGLRLFCSRRVLLWSDGQRLDKREDYVNWGPQWHYASTYIPCKAGDKYAGVTLSPIRQAGYAGKGLRWFAIAPRHAVSYSIIEYPNGGQ